MFGAPLGILKFPIKRIKFGIKLRWICFRKGFRFKKCRWLWLCGGNGSRKCNFIVDTGRERLQVKLIGVRSRRVFFGFINEQNYENRDLTFADTRSWVLIPYDMKMKKPYAFEEGTKHFIVMTPISNVVTVRENNYGRVQIGNGDIVPEGKFYFARAFLKMLKEM